MTTDVEPDQQRGAPHPRATFAFSGHEEAESALAAAWAGGRMHHAWLLCGPKGLGKATLAYRFARHVLGAPRIGPRPFDVDPSHPVSRKIAQLAHPDLFVLRRAVGERGKPKRDISAEDARGLGAFFSLSASDGGWRVGVVDAVDELNRFAANALLKNLEEPPPRSVLLLVCHAPGATLSTIRSRCRRLSLHPLAESDVRTAMVAAAPDTEVDPAALRLAAGRPGRAIAFQAAGASSVESSVDRAIATAGRTGADAFIDLALMARAGGEERVDFVLELVQAACVRAAGDRLQAPSMAESWAEAWSALANLRQQWEGLNMDAGHTVIRAGQIVARCAGPLARAPGGRA